jgi:hypothetical protein
VLRRLLKLGAVLAVVTVLLVVCAYGAFVAFEGHPPRWVETTEVCAQPSSVTYVDGTYAVFLLEPRITLGVAEEPPRAVVSHTGDGSYGTVVALAEDTSTDDVTCSWDADGVTVADGLDIGHRVPATVFTGGR